MTDYLGFLSTGCRIRCDERHVKEALQIRKLLHASSKKHRTHPSSGAPASLAGLEHQNIQSFAVSIIK